ncbi:proline--tRNA ligase [Candidatus Woesearchaeota archaeon]|nr:proline--tRNA ligase [Candidatus Woesearchaeota archaeon]
MAAKQDPKENLGISIKKNDDPAEWYGQVCLKAELAEYAPVKGCMIIRPRGYFIWETLQHEFDRRIKKLGVQNASFPLFIPESFFEKEKSHAQGFAPEVAWIANKYEGERIAVRPTSETIICDSFKRWIRSHRDLPLRINQWCNVVRWETEATKLFLRTREFLWQEGHCVYATSEECEKEVLLFLNEYEKILKDLLALPVIKGLKTEKERFAGALRTYTLEAYMPDGKALQCGTSHHLGQGFMKSFEVSFIGEDEKKHVPYSSSWGISTRLLGAVVLLHSDDKGLVLPPFVAQNQVVVIPIIFEKNKNEIQDYAKKVWCKLDWYRPLYDDREDHSAGYKYAEWELKGIPLRVEIGPKDFEKNQVVVVRRDTGEKEFVLFDQLEQRIPIILQNIHDNLYEKAKKNLEKSTLTAESWESFTTIIAEGKLAKMPHCTESKCEEEIKDKTKGVSARCIPLEENSKILKNKKCFHCKKDAQATVIFGRSY